MHLMMANSMELSVLLLCKEGHTPDHTVNKNNTRQGEVDYFQITMQTYIMSILQQLAYNVIIHTTPIPSWDAM